MRILKHGCSLCPQKAQKTYRDMIDSVKGKTQEGLGHCWMKMKTHFQDELASLAARSGDKMLWSSSDVQSSLGKGSALFRSRAIKVIDRGSSSKRSSAVEKKTKIA